MQKICTCQSNENKMIDNLCPEASEYDRANPFFSLSMTIIIRGVQTEIKGQIQFWGRDAYFKEHKAEYTKLWITLGLRYPKTYLMAWMKMTNGYWGWKDIQASAIMHIRMILE